MSSPALSIVVPFHNEGENVTALVREIARIATRLPSPLEAIFIDDGSTDDTGARLATAAQDIPGSRIIRFRRNRGQGTALYVGIQAAQAPVIVTMDGDGQNNPGDIPLLLELLSSADLVVGIRTPRQDTVLRRVMAKVANAIRSRFLHDGVQDTGCGLKAFRREVAESLHPIKSLYSFIPAMAAAAGYRIAEIPVSHRPRSHGRSHYGLGVFLRQNIVDMFGVYWLCQRRMPRASTVTETR